RHRDRRLTCERPDVARHHRTVDAPGVHHARGRPGAMEHASPEAGRGHQEVCREGRRHRHRGRAPHDDHPRQPHALPRVVHAALRVLRGPGRYRPRRLRARHALRRPRRAAPGAPRGTVAWRVQGQGALPDGRVRGRHREPGGSVPEHRALAGEARLLGRRDREGHRRQHHARAGRGVGALSGQPLVAERRLAGLRVGVYGSGGAPWHHLALASVHGADVRIVRAEDIKAGRLEELDALVFPGGGALAMAGLIAPLGETGATAVRDWVERGGTYVGSCAGSVLPIALAGAADAAVPAARCLRLVNVPLANTGDETLGGLASPGVGRIVVRLDTGHPYAEGLPERIELVHYNGPLFDVSRAGHEVTAFGWPVSATSGFTPAERFLETPDEPFVGETTLERCVRLAAATALESRFGSGHVVLFGSHPEFGLDALGLGWSHGAQLLVAALAGTAGAAASGDESEGSASCEPSYQLVDPRPSEWLQ